MGTFYQRCDGLRDRVRSYAIAGYLRFRSSFFLIAIILFIFYTFCVLLSTTVSIWSPRLDSGDLKKGAAKELGTVASDAQAFSSKVPTITSEVPATISTVPAFTPEVPTIISEVSTSTSEIPKVTSEVSTHPSAVPAITSQVPPITSEIPTNPSEVPAIDHGKYPEKDPLIDLGKPLGKNPVIDLGYTKYQGVTRKTGVTQWLGIRYAAPPLGDLRFAEPKDPLNAPAVQRADKRGNKCLAYRKRPDHPGYDEDCLFLDLYVPSDATTGAKLPVLFYMPAGGFNFNAGADSDRSGLVMASKGNIIVVSAHYRVGPYGFIASKEIQRSKTASTNNGLRDQRKALQWVQKHIRKFGGDPGHVVIGGGSAGGASVSLQMSAYGGRDDGLFHAAIGQSASFGPVLDVAESQYQYDYLVHQMGCIDAHDTLACLRSKPASEIQLKNINIPYPQGRSGQRTPKFMWNPVIDEDILQDHTYRAFYEGKFVRVPAIFGDDTNGGSGFAPKSSNSLRDFNSFLAAQFPALTREQLGEIDTLYQNTSVQFPNTGHFWRQTGTAYGEIRYMCPNMFLASAMARYKGATGWNYRYNVEDPRLVERGYGVPHIAEMNAIWGPNIMHGLGWMSYLDLNKQIIPVIRGYWLSFIKTYNPNTLRYPGSPEWEEWSPSLQRRLVFETNNTRMEVVDPDQQERCSYLSSIAVDIQQ